MTNISKLLPASGFLIAAVLVMATSAFKQAPKTKGGDALYTFQYNPPTGTNPYSESNVEAKGHWSYTATTDRCSDDDVKACKIYVSGSNVVPSGSSYTLASGFTISATESSPNIAYVSATSDGSDPDYISNQDN